MDHTWSRQADLYRPAPAISAPHRPGQFLKICFILEPLHAGVGRYVVDIACELAARGHHIHVIYSPVRLEPQFLADISGHPRIRHHAIPMKPGPCPGDLRAFRQVLDYVRANGPFDIIHGHSSKGGVIARLLTLFGVGPVLYSPHAFVTRSPLLPHAQRYFYGMIENALARLTDRIVCVSQDEKDHAARLGISHHRVALVIIGRSPRPAAGREAVRGGLGIGPNKVVIGYVGRLCEQKAPERLIEACLRLMPEMPDLHLLMVGDGPQRAVLQQRLENVGLGSRVTWLGEVEATQFMPAMDMFTLPSRYEGFAYVLIEALQAGLPIVATPVGGARESVLPGGNGFIVPHDSIDAMADALGRLARDGRLRQAMAQASRVHATYFSVTRMVDDIEALYHHRLGARNAVGSARRNRARDTHPQLSDA